MHNFDFYNRTRIVFGEGTIARLGELAQPLGKKALLVYGKGSIKSNGVYDQVVESLNAAGIEFVEFSGVKPNPTLTHTREGIALAKAEKVDMIIAVGGGSVLDESKAIAAGAVSDADVWDFFLGKAEVDTALPVLTVLTLAATGSEMNGGLVVTNEETHEKLGMIKEPLQPIASILDPSTTYSVNAAYTAYSSVDAICHLLESYLTHSDDFAPLQDRYVESIVKTIIEVTDTILESPDNYQARAIMMWAATMAWNGTAPSGVGPFILPHHFIGHSMSALYDTPHGASLSIMLPAWMTWRAAQDPSKIAQFAKTVFDIDEADPAEAARLGIAEFEGWCRKIGSPTTLSAANIPLEGGPEAIAANAAPLRHMWGLPDYDEALILEILKPAIR